MPHSTSPETMPVDDQSQTISQVSQIETVKEESQDVEMAGTPDADQETTKNEELEALFDDDDDDDEFGSSAPQIKEESSQVPSQPAPMYALHS